MTRKVVISKGPNCCSDETVSFHRMDTNQIRKMYDLWMKYKIKPDSFNFSTITDKIFL